MNFTFDLLTAQFILGLVFAVNSLFAVIFLSVRQHFRGVVQWIIAQILLTIGSSILLFAHVFPPIIAVAFSNTAFIAAITFYAHTAWSLRLRRKFPRLVYAAIPLVFGLFALLLPATVGLRIVVFSLIVSPLSLAVFGLLVWRVRREARFAGWITGLPFAGTGLFHLVRIVDVIANPGGGGWFYSPQGTGPLVFILAIVTASLSLFGYFLLASSRFEYRLLRKESLIRRQISRLRELNHTKDVFFSIVAHDLRGPVGGAARYVRKHLLNSKAKISEKREAIQTLADSLDRTNTFLENLLWWARSQRNDWQPLRIRVNLAEICRDAIFATAEFAREKQVTIDFRSVAYFVEAEPVSLRLIIQNLLSNAIKFSYRGGVVTLICEYQRAKVIVQVVDKGIGMEPDYVKTLFKIDRKTTTHGTEGEFGTGLGLILCRSFADRNRAELVIESQLGEGTRAELRLDLAPRFD